MSEYKRAVQKRCSNPNATIKSRGRAEDVPNDEYRTDFERDIHRIIYSQSFRRLRHKTQVFYFPQNDHVSTRLDHVIFVASAARSVARCLGLNEDLAEAIGLAHDIGHAPFGHQGEKFLNQIIEKHSCLKKIIPQFSHELYGLRVVDKIAMRDRQKPGLNLTWEVRDGIVSHCGEDYESCKLAPEKEKQIGLEQITDRKKAGNPATLEGCIVRMVDKVAYLGKDIEDAIAAGIIEENQIPKQIKTELGHTNGQIIGTLLKDIIQESKGKDYIAISKQYGDIMHNQIKQFNEKYIYKSHIAEGYKKQAGNTIHLLFDDLLNFIQDKKRFVDFQPQDKDPTVYKIFAEFFEAMKGIYKDKDSDPDELIVLDFIAGMTDSFVVRSFQELFVPKATV